MRLDDVVPMILAETPQALAVYLFGSQARGETHSASDVDLAVLGPRKLDPLVRWHLQEALAAKLSCNVDLVDLRAASTVMRVQVIDGGRLLHDGAPTERALFEATALSDYARLQEERRGILDDIKQRGHVYG